MKSLIILSLFLLLSLSLSSVSGKQTSVSSRKQRNGLNTQDVLLELSKKKKKKGHDDDDGGDGAGPATAAAAAAPVAAGPVGNGTAPVAAAAAAAPVAAAPAKEEKKDVKPKGPEITPCLPGIPNYPCNQFFSGVIMPGRMDPTTGQFEPGQFMNGMFIRGQTINGSFFPTPKTGPDPKVEEARKKLEAETAKLAKEAKERKEKLDREDKLRLERDEKDEKERKERLERESKEEKDHREKVEKEEKERQRAREREEEEYLRQKENRELEERRLQHQKERDERIEEEHKKELKEEEARQEAFEKKSKELHERIDELQAKTAAETQKMKEEIMAKTKEEVQKALNHKKAAHILGENMEKQGFVEGAYEGIIDTKKAADFGKDVQEEVNKAVKEAEAKAFARGQIKELAKARAKLEAAERIDEAFKAGVAAAQKRAAEEEAERLRDKALVERNATAGATAVTGGDGRVLAAATPARPSWAYTGALGQPHWGGVCKSGPQQSPINIYGIAKSDAEGEIPLKPLGFSYVPSAINLEFTEHSIRMLYDRGSSFSANGVTYDLKSIEFHTPSEHKVRGLHFPLEIQLMHTGRENPQLRSVVSILATEGPESAALALFWDALPKLQGDKVSAEGANFNVADILPLSHAYFAYEGSETRPPCTEGVIWYVLTHYITASPKQIQRIIDLTGENNREIQTTNGRRIRQFSPEDKVDEALKVQRQREEELKKANA